MDCFVAGLRAVFRLCLCILILQLCPVAIAQETPEAAQEKSLPTLKVGTKEAPPFAMLGEDGKWAGLSIGLWDRIAEELKREYEFVSYDSVEALLEACEKGEVDVAMAAVTVTAEREKTVDFSHPYYNSGLAIVISKENTEGFWGLFRALTSPTFLATIGTLLALLFVTGALIWWVEHKHNPEQFEKDTVRGVGSGFWWSAVTMTTVGYGDKAPKSPWGRAIAIVWMFAALIITAVFTAQLASSLTADRISGPVSGVSDLGQARVGVIENAASNAYFSRQRIPMRMYEDVKQGLEALEVGRIDAFVHDEPIVRFTIRQNPDRDLHVLPPVFERQDYGIVIPEDSPLREPINRALLGILNSDDWIVLRAQYFGTER